MAEIINLNKARKAKQKAEAKKTAADNRAFFGVSSKLRNLQKARDDKEKLRLEAHRLTPNAQPPQGDAPSASRK